MSVKSTVVLTRAEAERKYHELFAKLNPRDNYLNFSDRDLEDILEIMNDKASNNGYEGFENYWITDD